jgi:5-formyltetrahydrofolate cyclo-ligase
VSASPGEIKAELRRNLRAQAQSFSPAQRAAASLQICARLKKRPIWASAQSILFYYPISGEPNIQPLFAEALAAGKCVVLPRYSPPNGHYEICQVGDLEKDLQRGAFGIHEPNPGCPLFDPKKLDLILVPGIGFALNGLRLGRGKGYYDRLLAEMPGTKCGVAFDWQVAVEIPAEPHDIYLNCILTPTRWQDVAGPCGF